MMSKPKEPDSLPPLWTTWTAGSYAVVMLLIGLPLWWKTTAVQRVQLPYTDMASLRDFVDSSFRIKIPINLVGFSKVTQNDKFQDVDGYSFKIDFKQANPLEMDAIYKSADIYAIDKSLCQLGQKNQSEINSINVYYVGRSDLLKEYGQRIILGNCRSFYYISNSSKIKFELIWNVLKKLVGSNEENETQELPLSAGYNILFSLLVPEPEVLDSKWEIERAVNDYINPMLLKLKTFSEFSVRSQVLYYIKLNVFPKWNHEEKYFQVPYEQLPLVINPVESKLASFVSQNPVLNFLTYTTPCSKTPLQILEADGTLLNSNAFLVPQWGGIFIYNSPCNENSTKGATHQVSTDQVMGVMISQFRSLIGLEDNEPDTLELRATALRDWEVDMILRRRLRKLMSTATNTLHSLGQLLDEITNIVVTEEVGDQVEKGVAAIKSAIQEALEGRLSSAHMHATEAFKCSEVAFHHPKNLKQLYFPDDQKYAIYIPLFLPAGIPVLLSLRGIFQRVFFRNKVKVE